MSDHLKLAQDIVTAADRYERGEIDGNGLYRALEGHLNSDAVIGMARALIASTSTATNSGSKADSELDSWLDHLRVRAVVQGRIAPEHAHGLIPTPEEEMAVWAKVLPHPQAGDSDLRWLHMAACLRQYAKSNPQTPKVEFKVPMRPELADDPVQVMAHALTEAVLSERKPGFESADVGREISFHFAKALDIIDQFPWFDLKNRRLLAAVNEMDTALCNYINGCGDDYEPVSEWDQESEDNFRDLTAAYNRWHELAAEKVDPKS